MTSEDRSDEVSTGDETAIVPGPIRIHGERRADQVEIGSKLGRYVLLERVGMGGMGVVYAAFDPELDRKIALKLLWPGSKDDARTRLVRGWARARPPSRARSTSRRDL